ncbi:MAG: heparinase II/III domain-containing protein [Limnochordia bacterium]
MDDLRREQAEKRAFLLWNRRVRPPTAYPFRLNGGKTWRARVELPASLYKRVMVENARSNFAGAIGRQTLRTLMHDVRLVMDYDDEDIAHMIPETTPTAAIFTPSPVSDRGFPHGDWEWSPSEPDVITDRATGMRFPNENHPEDIVLTTTFGGRQQCLAFNRSKDWVYNGFPLATSFTGHIRARKVGYMAQQVEKLGLLYALTGDLVYARQAKAILLRFAHVYPGYMIHSGYHEFAAIDPLVAAGNITALPADKLVVSPNRPNRRLHAGYWMAGRASGEGREGSFLLPVTIAYDLVAEAADAEGQPLFFDEERISVERDLLLEGTKLLLADSDINNKSITARTAVAAIGSVLGDPLLVRWGLDGLRRTLDEWFLSDGSTSESPAYALAVLGSMWQLGEILHGYSDPEGYADADGHRLDNLNIYRDHKYQAVWRNMYLSLLPNLRYPPIADSFRTNGLTEMMMLLMALRYDDMPEYKGLYRERMSDLFLLTLYKEPQFDMGGAPTLSFPDALFPAWKLAYLRGGRSGRDTAVTLSMSDWGGHHHHDSLNLTYWKDGQELLSDLGYLADSPSAHMTTRSVAHNLVVVDEMNQQTQGRGGSVQLFHPLGRLKVMEGASNAYHTTSLYRRFVAQVEHPGENSYVFDVFRVAGGGTHDLLFHGPGQQVQPEGIQLHSSGTQLGRYQFSNARGGRSEDWRLRWRAGSLTFQTLAIAAQDEQVLLADGWGQRATKDPYTTLPYVIRRRSIVEPVGGLPTLESQYLSVYEGYRTEPLVESAQRLPLSGEGLTGAAGAVAVEIKAGHHTDCIISATQPATVSATTRHGELRFQGLAGITSLSDQGVEIMGVIGGRRVSIGDYDLAVLAAEDSLAGEIVHELPDGFVVNGVHSELLALVGWEVFVDDGRDETAYPIRAVELQETTTAIKTQDRRGGYPFSGARGWSIPHVGYLEVHTPEVMRVCGTAPLRLSLPQTQVDCTRLGWLPALGKEGLAETLEHEDWQPVSFTTAGDMVQMDISFVGVPTGSVWLRFR